jgi:hypothetical protein
MSRFVSRELLFLCVWLLWRGQRWETVFAAFFSTSLETRTSPIVICSFESCHDRSVQMMSPAEASIGVAHSRSIPRPMSLAGPSSAFVTNADVIDKESFFGVTKSMPTTATTTTTTDDVNSNWVPTQLRPVPAFYPLERSSRFVEDDLPSVAARLSEANRVLSVQAIYNNETVRALSLER